jgi:molybdopterin molybdotransferase
LPVVRKLRVAVFFTGDELAMPGEDLKPGAIYNSNKFTLRGLLQNLGCDITDFGIVPDTLAATRETLRRAAAEHDLIITSGGVSVGEEDHIKPALEAEGRVNMWQIAVKPGKPLAFGEVNRVSAELRLCVFPRLAGQSGIELRDVPVVRATVHSAPARCAECGAKSGMRCAPTLRWRKAIAATNFCVRKSMPSGGLDLFPNQSSGVLTSTVWGDGLIDNPPNNSIAPGDLVRFISFSDLMY